MTQEAEIKLRDQQARNYCNFVLSSRGSYWIQAQIGLVIKMLELTPKMEIYDAGAGIGLYALKIAERFPDSHILALDFSSESLNQLNQTARERGITNIQTVQANILDYQPQSNYFDRTYCVEVLQHIPGHEGRAKALQIFYHSLKRGGRLVTMNYRWGGWVKPPKPKEEINHEEIGLYRYFFTVDELAELFKKTGFRKVKSFGVIRFPKRFQKYLSSWMAVPLEQFLNMVNINNNNAQYILTVGEK